jgi:O-antigen/teichoic acid export membrane protein
LFIGISAALLVLTFDHSSTALLRFGSEEHVLNGHVGVVLGTMLAVASACTLLISSLLLVFSDHLDAYFGRAGNYALPLLLFVATWPLFQGLRIVLQATGEFRRYSLMPIVRSGVLLAAILGVVSLWKSASVDVFVWAYVGSIPVAWLLTIRWVPWHTVLPLRFSVAHLKRAGPWLITMFLGSVTGYVLVWTDSLVLSVISDATSVGIYAVASRLFYQLSVLPELLTVVLLPKLVH